VDFWRHIRALETANETERFTNGNVRQFYTTANVVKSLTEPGWVRIWTAKYGGRVVGHASLIWTGEPGCVAGFIGVEKEFRGLGVYKKLQRDRLAYCDRHNLTLVGVVTEHNQSAIAVHEKFGYEVLRYDPELRELWLYREPVGKMTA
jgi:GNAT superfamily N-acetyltransferase